MIQRQKLITIVVIISILAAVPTYLLLKLKGGPGEVPVYGRADEDEAKTSAAREQMKRIGFEGEVKVYRSSDSSSTIVGWYRTEMTEQGWTKESEFEGTLLFRKGNQGVMVGIERFGEATLFKIYVGNWFSIKLLWEFIRPITPPRPLTVSLTIDGNTAGSTILWLMHMGGDVLENAFEGSAGILTWKDMEVRVTGMKAGEGKVAIYNGVTDWSGTKDFRLGDVLQIKIDLSIGDFIAVTYRPLNQILMEVRVVS